MNIDTIRTVNQIKANGYYRKGTTMGEGGWSEVVKIGNFKEYVLRGDGETVETIHALGDDIAKLAFSNLYHLDMFEIWEVYEHIHQFRTVAGNID